MQRLYSKQDTGDWAEGSGVVVRLLQDDEERHQRLVVDLRNGQTLLLAHNTGVAERVPVSLGDRVKFRGIFEWNEQGGVVHWTHRDPMGLDEGGYIEHRRNRYR